MDNVDVFLTNSSGNVILTDITDSDGEYDFTGVPDGTYTVTFSTDQPAGGVSLTDAYMVMMHLFNIAPLSGFPAMKADVNSSGTITWPDYYEIIFSYLNQGNPFSGGEWDFESYSVTVPDGSRTEFTTSGGSNGDVNGTFQPPKYGNCFVNNGSIPSVVLTNSEKASINLKAEQPQDISGLHMVFGIPEGITVETVNSPLPELEYYITGNEIRITWMNYDLNSFEIDPSLPLVEFEISANTNVAAGEELFFNLLPESHLIGKDGQLLPFVNLSLPGIKFKAEELISVRENIYPNPFFASATLEYVLPADGNIKIIVSNNAGQIIRVVADEFQIAGPHRISIDGSDWPTGVYHYAIQFAGEKTMFKTGSMIKSK
jgi:hypothetical protein